MRLPPSWLLFAMIVVGGAVAVISNTLYPIAKSNEAKTRLAKDSRSILFPEIQRNSALVSNIQSQLQAGTFPLQTFDVTAWETISKGGLLLGLDPDEITQFLNIYRLAYQANHLLAQLLEVETGIGSALASAPETKKLVTHDLELTLNELRNAFAAVEQHP
jgi:hypothetical protein